MAAIDSTPILVGVGQVVSHWSGEPIADAPDPVSLCKDASQKAIQDTGAETELKRLIDKIVVVRTNADSVPGAKYPFGRCENPPATIARQLGLDIEDGIYSEVGGDQPQALVSEFAERLFKGECRAVLLTGGEAIGAMKLARKRGIRLDWSGSADGPMEDRGLGDGLLTKYEMANGLGFPPQTYPLFDNALRARWGLSRAEYTSRVAHLFAGFSNVAAQNPYAQFPEARDTEFLSTPSKENYRLTDPYLKWHVAQDAVNQGAALIMTTVGAARSMGITEEKWVYLHSYATAKDKPVSLRPDLSRSAAIELVLAQTLEAAGKSASDIGHFDIYSCFPSVVFLAADALGVDWRKTQLTVTGGLPFFGGAGNNYAMHAIASMVETLRENPRDYGLVLANGGFMSKEAAGLYSTKPMDKWAPIENSDLSGFIADQSDPTLVSGNCEGQIVSYSISYSRHGPNTGYVVAETDSGRVVARVHTGHRATLKALIDGSDLIGSRIAIHSERGKNYVSARAPIASVEDNRTFETIKVVRNGHILEVTLNRPEAYNSLAATSHFELGEVFDEFERDQDLWVAIITGAGDKAFCSGNDLKATASGGDVSSPPSGFGGLCSRFHRRKPVIAAVNGVAMGGGLEIVLASDLAVLDPRAKCALPEVRVGLFAAAGGVQRLTQQIPYKQAMDLILTGRHFGAEEAVSLGVANAISEPGKVMESSRAIAEMLMEASPSAIQASKRVINEFEQCGLDVDASMKAGTRVFGELMRTKDFKEGVSAFIEKRSPIWSNS